MSETGMTEYVDLHEAKAATPHSDLIAQLLDSRIPKSEREHAAAKEITALLRERDELQAEVDELKVVAKCASEQQDSLFSEARTLNERADKLEEALRLIESAKDRGFGIDYARGVAQSALGSRACRVDGEGE